MSDRSLLLVNVLPPDEGEDGDAPGGALGTVSLGRYRQVVETLGRFNAHEEGLPETRGVLHAPGMIFQMPLVGEDDPVMQVLITFNDESIAWSVLERICKSVGWKMMDPRSGRTFG